jgi:UPF0755 protein
MMRDSFRLVGWAFLAVSAILILAGGAGWWVYREATRSGPLVQEQTVVLPPHTGLSGVATLLREKGVIRHRLPFEIAAVVSGNGKALLAGEYAFPPGISAFDASNKIASGEIVSHKLTIPEGLTSAQIVKLVRNAPALEGDVGQSPPDGALMPATYVYRYGESRRALLARMERKMSHALATVWAKREPDLPFANPAQMLTLASLVEREAARADERTRIAAVFINRLRLGMRLESDPTVIYSLSAAPSKKLDHPLTRADLQTPSPYNTYLEKGLPPGPIDNPGIAALTAAARPAPTNDLYFVADRNGGHVFARTLAEHDRNVAQYRGRVPIEPDPLEDATR